MALQKPIIKSTTKYFFPKLKFTAEDCLENADLAAKRNASGEPGKEFKASSYHFPGLIPGSINKHKYWVGTCLKGSSLGPFRKVNRIRGQEEQKNWRGTQRRRMQRIKKRGKAGADAAAREELELGEATGEERYCS